MKRALLFATGYQEEMEPLIHYRPQPLLSIVDRPIIMHIIEALNKQGVEQFDLILSHLPHMIEEALGDGKRWGIRITYHLAKDPNYPFPAIRPTAREWGNELIYLGRGDSLPVAKGSLNLPDGNECAMMFYPDKTWSGWGILPASALINIPATCHADHLIEHLPTDYEYIPVRHFLSVKTMPQYKRTNLLALRLKAAREYFPTSSKMVEPGIWISRGVSIHPTAEIIPPVFIGEGCQINGDTQIGPYAVIERNCIVDHSSHVERTLICQHSYIGDGLDIKNSIIDRNILINTSLDTILKIREDFILSELTPFSFKNYLLKLISRLVGLILFITFSPLLILLLISMKIRKERMLKLPTTLDRDDWETFEYLTLEHRNGKRLNSFQVFFQRLPTLLNIAKGEVGFVGVAPRGLKDADPMPQDWKKLYVQSKIGMITLADLDYGSGATEDEIYASEVYYATHYGFFYDLKLLLRWIRKKTTTGLKMLLRTHKHTHSKD